MKRRISNHGKKRMEERAGISHDGDAKKNCSKALNRGIRHSETRGELNVWLKRVGKEKAAPEETRLVYSGEEDDTPNPFAELLKEAIEGVRSEP